MDKPPVRDRLARAAFELFDERGYEQTTVDDIAERAGLGRATFFRHYRSKEDVIFPDHDRLVGQVRDRLRSSSHATALAAVSDAVRLVLLHYLDEGDLARRRYALTSTVPALRDREIVSVARYQRLFREFITDWMAEPAQAGRPAGRAHGRRRRLRAQPRPAPLAPRRRRRSRPRGGRGHAPGHQPLHVAPADSGPDGSTVLAFRTSRRLDALLPAIRQLLETGEP